MKSRQEKQETEVNPWSAPRDRGVTNRAVAESLHILRCHQRLTRRGAAPGRICSGGGLIVRVDYNVFDTTR